MKKQLYQTPTIKVVRFAVEHGFTGSQTVSFSIDPEINYGTEEIQQHGDVIGRDALTRI